MFVCLLMHIYTDIFYFFALSEPQSSDTPTPVNRPDIEILVPKYYSLILKQGKFEMSLKYLIVAENEVLKELYRHVKGYINHFKELSLAESEKFFFLHKKKDSNRLQPIE